MVKKLQCMCSVGPPLDFFFLFSSLLIVGLLSQSQGSKSKLGKALPCFFVDGFTIHFLVYMHIYNLNTRRGEARIINYICMTTQLNSR
uniref:Uncharacterized protein n=1 Tax=Nelumbo nucifera TaxID=4432 RepID=A0A822XSI7_NELNU|nr:TPA_asm: hypothetical protein HUJ06_023512 [Nelumbo nucifera]